MAYTLETVGFEFCPMCERITRQLAPRLTTASLLHALFFGVFLPANLWASLVVTWDDWSNQIRFVDFMLQLACFITIIVSCARLWAATKVEGDEEAAVCGECGGLPTPPSVEEVPSTEDLEERMRRARQGGGG